MENIDIINRIIKIVGISVITYFTFIKLTTYKENNYIKKIAITFTSIIVAIIGICLSRYITTLLVILICYSLLGFNIAILTKNKIIYSIIYTFISLTITYSVYILSILLSSIILRILTPNIQKENIFSLVLILIIESVILYRIFKIRRLKNGFPFLQDENKISYIGNMGFAIIGATIISYSLISDHNNKNITVQIIIGIIIELICITIWIKSKMTQYYKKKLKENTIQELENEIEEKDKKINKILDENRAIATINHKYSNRIKSLENFSNKIMSNAEIVRKMEAEFGEDFTNFKKQVTEVASEYKEEMEKQVKKQNKLEKTGNFGIDNILEYMNSEAIKNNINLCVKIDIDINYMIKNLIEQGKLETLLGDHIKDAIIAIHSNDNLNKRILVNFSQTNNCYEVSIYDTGIEFEIETLLKLGLQPVTTHKISGGSGIGFMTTFETLAQTKASLIIEEKHPMNNTDYTKAVIIRFDGNSEYKIISYRAQDVMNRIKEDNFKRIKIEEII